MVAAPCAPCLRPDERRRSGMTRLNWQDRADHRLDGRRRSRGPTARASWRRSCSRLISLATSMAPASLSTPCTPRPIWTRPCAPGRHHALEQRRGRRPGDPQSRRLACARSAERPLLQLTGGSARGRTGVWRRGAPPPQCDQPRADQPFLYSHGFCRIGEVTPPADPARTRVWCSRRLTRTAPLSDAPLTPWQ
jgi:hypothetical protein